MEIIRRPAEMTRWARQQAAAGRRICLVPTMGFFHEGHLRLMDMAGRHGDLVVVSLFVNPTQFGPGEDLDAYPRDVGRDRDLAAGRGVDLLFVPDADAMYPPGFQTRVEVEKISRHLCGRFRPGHFAGVTTVVCKLLNIVRPDAAVFGEKDFQQLAVIRQMVRDLNMDVEILAHPTVREEDGLAMSSRNAYLDARLRPQARCLYQALERVRELVREGELDCVVLRQEVERLVGSYPDAELEYAEFVHRDTLAETTRADRQTVLALAVRLGERVRLIDNGLVAEHPDRT